MADLLIEFGCEDLPAASIVPMAQHLASGLHIALSKADLGGDEPRIYATPRRIAALWPGVGDCQPDQTIERRGPSVQAAYKDGEPTKALAGFLKSAGASLDQVSTITTAKGEWTVITQTQAGQSLAALVAAAMPDIIKTMPVPRRMRWADFPHEFLRPVNWLLAVHGDKVLPLSVLGLSAGNVTYGHRFHAPMALTINTPNAYKSALEKAHVVADFDERRGRIVEQVRQAASMLGGAAVMDEELVDEVTALVEWPVALAGHFEAEFLKIPKEALIQTMQENQRYFALLDEHSKLMPAFITVANIESNNPKTVIDGNERVIRPRFADTMFFWQADCEKSLEQRLPELDGLLFQKKLGSVRDKVLRMQTLSAWLASKLGASVDDCGKAVQLCKCDLASEIVKELPKMQGIAGRYYAARDGENESISNAMEQHYYPKHAGGDLPAGKVAQVVALADKIDSLVGIFGIGLKPSGTKDPFGLRRAALGIVRILIEQQHDVEVDELIDQSIATFGNLLPDVNRQELIDYVLDRLRAYAAEQGYQPDVVDAVLAKQLSNPLDIAARLQAIREFRETPAGASLSAASKRIGNILKKADTEVPAEIDASLLVEPAEKTLHAALLSAQPDIQAQFTARRYTDAMTSTAALGAPVDQFFDGVMVMSEDAALRANRLALLQQLDELCSYTARLSRLQPDNTDHGRLA
jgi:glycyl-tRNA synthetase beta chain